MFLHNERNVDWVDRGSYKKKVIVKPEHLGDGNILVQIVSIKPKSKVDGHYHKRHTEIFYILEGRGKITINDEEKLCKPGDVFICRPNDVHSAVNESDDEFKILVIKINYVENDIFWL